MAAENKTDNAIVIDGKDLILGRMGSLLAKRLLLGEEIKIVNCKDVVILGRKPFLVKRYKDKINNKVIKQGPYYSRSPADLVKRAFRNMLPYKSARGAEAFRRLTCYNSTPSTLINAKKEELKDVKVDSESVFYYTRVEEISRSLGYTKEK